MSRKRKGKNDGVLKQYRHEVGRIGGGYGAIYPASVLGQPEDSFGAGVIVPDRPASDPHRDDRRGTARTQAEHGSGQDRCVRVGTTADADLLARARSVLDDISDAELVDEALSALLARGHRSADSDEAREAAPDTHPTGESDELADPAMLQEAAT